MSTLISFVAFARLSAVATLGALALTGPAAAQMFGMPPPQQQVPPCYNEFMPLRQEAEKRGAAIKAAAERKAPPDEICKLFKRFAEAEATVLKFVVKNASFCGIPPNAAGQMQANHAKTIQVRNRICSGGPGGPPGAIKPTGPGLSEALGTARLPGLSPGSTPSGTFDTLHGNVLSR